MGADVVAPSVICKYAVTTGEVKIIREQFIK